MFHEKYDKLRTKLMKEMFKRVGRKYDPEVCKHENWFMTSSWTEEEQNDFKQWAEIQAMHALGLTDVGARREIGWFLLSYGWTLKERVDV